MRRSNLNFFRLPKSTGKFWENAPSSGVSFFKNQKILDVNLKQKMDTTLKRINWKADSFTPLHQLIKNIRFDRDGERFINDVKKIAKISELRPLVDASGIFMNKKSLDFYYVGNIPYQKLDGSFFSVGQYNKESKTVLIRRYDVLDSTIVFSAFTNIVICCLMTKTLLAPAVILSLCITLGVHKLSSVFKNQYRQELSSTIVHELTHLLSFSLPDIPDCPSIYDIKFLRGSRTLKEENRYNLKNELIRCVENNNIKSALYEDKKNVEFNFLGLLKLYWITRAWFYWPFLGKDPDCEEIKARISETIIKKNNAILEDSIPNTYLSYNSEFLMRCIRYIILEHRVPFILERIKTDNFRIHDRIAECLNKKSMVEYLYNPHQSDDREKSDLIEIVGIINFVMLSLGHKDDRQYMANFMVNRIEHAIQEKFSHKLWINPSHKQEKSDFHSEGFSC